MAFLGVIGDLRYAYTYEWQSDYSKVIPIYASVSATQLTILALWRNSDWWKISFLVNAIEALRVGGISVWITGIKGARQTSKSNRPENCECEPIRTNRRQTPYLPLKGKGVIIQQQRLQSVHMLTSSTQLTLKCTIQGMQLEQIYEVLWIWWSWTGTHQSSSCSSEYSRKSPELANRTDSSRWLKSYGT